MSNRDYEDGVRNGQRGGIGDDFCQGLADTGSDYDKGYAYGVDNRRDSSGERYHTWSNDGKNDPKSESNSESWFGGSSSSKSSSSSSSSSSDSDSSISSSSSYNSGGGGYSDGGGYSSPSLSKGKPKEDISVRTFVGTIAAMVLGGTLFYNYFINSNTNLQLEKPAVETVSVYNNNLTLEEKVNNFTDSLKKNHELVGNFNDYVMFSARKVQNTDSDYELAFFSQNAFYTYHSSDNGKTWAPLPPTDPFFQKLNNDYLERKTISTRKFEEESKIQEEGEPEYIPKYPTGSKHFSKDVQGSYKLEDGPVSVEVGGNENTHSHVEYNVSGNSISVSVHSHSE